jgi:hypothetical protein
VRTRLLTASVPQPSPYSQSFFSNRREAFSRFSVCCSQRSRSITVHATISHHLTHISSSIRSTFMPASSTSLHKNIRPADRPLYPSPTMNIPHYPSKSNDFDHFHSQFQSLTISSHSPTSLTSNSLVSQSSTDSRNSGCTLGAPFSMSYNYQPKEVDDGPTIIDTFSPKPLVYELSPTSSASSDLDSHHSSPRSSFETFIATRSRVVRVCGVFLLGSSSPLTPVVFDN